MNKPSYKKEVIATFSLTPTVEGFEKNTVLFLTAFGLVSGELYQEDIHQDIGSQVIKKIRETVLKTHKETYHEVNEPLNENDGDIHLVNVKIRNGDNITVLPNLILFYDQIIGVSIGEEVCDQ